MPLIILLIFYPYLIAHKIAKHTKVEEDKINIKILIKSVLAILFYSIIFLCIIFILINLYDTSDVNTYSCSDYGWTRSCESNDSASIFFTSIAAIISTIIHHFLCKKHIDNIFKQNMVIFGYLFMYLFMGFIYFITFWIFVGLGGLMTTIHYSNPIVEILRYIAILLPSIIFLFSTNGEAEPIQVENKN